MGSTVPDLLSKVVDELHSVVVALVAGARYGTKIRLPHAMVMTFLFQRNLTTFDKLKRVLRLVVEHASNLAAFAAIYKSLLACLKWTSRHLRAGSSENANIWKSLGRTILCTIVDGPWLGETSLILATAPPGHAERSHHALIAGAIGGYFVWGRYSSVNYQIVLYLASRVIVGLWKRVAIRRGILDRWSHYQQHSYPLVAAAVWGIVMMLFEESPEVLHPSLKSSMDEIYRYGLPTRESQRSHDADSEVTSSDGAVV